jgi:hypothetical protein
LAAAIAIMGEDPAASWLTYAVIGTGFLLGALAALVVRGSRQRTAYLEQIMAAKDLELMTSPEASQPVPQLIPLDELPPLPLSPPPGGEGHA